MSAEEDEPQLVELKPGTVVRSNWKVTKQLGDGGCGVVYEVINRTTKKRAALKVEPKSDDKEDEILRMEVYVLRKLQGRKHILRVLSHGRTDTYNYLIMTLVASNLGDMRRCCPQQAFTLVTAARIAQQCLQAIKNVHDCGFVHRDIKPSNFALGATKNTQRTIYLIDFGLARQYELRTRDGKKILREPRSDVPFRGTVRYCSTGVHRRLEQGRHDDLWSLFYMMIEFVRGTLPWQSKSREETMDMKVRLSEKQLLAKCPSEFTAIKKHLESLTYVTKPEYHTINDQLENILNRHSLKSFEPFDWERRGVYYSHFKNKRMNLSVIATETDDNQSPRSSDSTNKK